MPQITASTARRSIMRRLRSSMEGACAPAATAVPSNARVAIIVFIMVSLLSRLLFSGALAKRLHTQQTVPAITSLPETARRKRRAPCRARSRLGGLARHRVLDQADDRGHDRAAGAAADELADDRADIEPATAAREHRDQ